MVGGIPIIESEFAVELVRARVYPRRKAKSSRHWERMDKKWLKRFGHNRKPCILKMGSGIFGGEKFIVHPALMPQLRKAVKELTP